MIQEAKMKKKIGIFQTTLCILLVASLMLTACGTNQIQEISSESPQEPEPSIAEETLTTTSSEGADISSKNTTSPAFEGPTTEEYIRQVVQDSIARIEQSGMSEFDKVKAAFDYLIEIGDYQRPVALDIWRIRSSGDTIPSYVETRGLNMLLFGVGTCEDYAAALIMLLEGMGIETRYMTGETYSRNGDLYYHSWTQAKVDGVWYHLDSELEDGISNGTVIYRYFMKGDDTMSASHFWGQRLIDSGRLEDGQIEEVTRDYIGENCPRDYPTPNSAQIAVTPRHDRDALREELLEELRVYEDTYGKLEYMELNIRPPVFVHYWYGREDEIESNRRDFISNYLHERLLIPPEST